MIRLFLVFFTVIFCNAQQIEPLKVLKNKYDSLNIALNTLLSNRNSYIDYLTRIVNIYIDTNKDNESIYNNYNIN